MAKVIEFYRPAPKAVLTLASAVHHGADGPHECVIQHTGKHKADGYHLCNCGLEWGDDTDAPATAAKDILTKLLEHADTIDQVLVLTMDKQGVLGFLGNCEGLAETVLFMELVKAQALFSRVEGPNGSGGAA